MNSTSRSGIPSYWAIPISPQPIDPSAFRKSWVYPTRNGLLMRERFLLSLLVLLDLDHFQHHVVGTIRQKPAQPLLPTAHHPHRSIRRKLGHYGIDLCGFQCNMVQPFAVSAQMFRDRPVRDRRDKLQSTVTEL